MIYGARGEKFNELRDPASRHVRTKNTKTFLFIIHKKEIKEGRRKNEE